MVVYRHGERVFPGGEDVLTCGIIYVLPVHLLTGDGQFICVRFGTVPRKLGCIALIAYRPASSLCMVSKVGDRWRRDDSQLVNRPPILRSISNHYLGNRSRIVQLKETSIPGGVQLSRQQAPYPSEYVTYHHYSTIFENRISGNQWVEQILSL